MQRRARRGVVKREFLEQEHGAEALAVMRSVKQAPDPRGIFEPGEDVFELRQGLRATFCDWLRGSR